MALKKMAEWQLAEWRHDIRAQFYRTIKVCSILETPLPMCLFLSVTCDKI